MSRDYKHRAEPEPANKQRAPAWVWMLVGLVAGGFVMGLVWLKIGAPPADDEKWVGAKPANPPQRVEVTKPITEVPPPKPRYEFYNELREKEVLVPEERLEERRTSEDETARFQIQVGSFSRADDAERLRAELAFLGIETRVARVHASGKQWHRVIAGPYLGRSELDKARKRLKDNNYGGLLIRMVP